MEKNYILASNPLNPPNGDFGEMRVKIEKIKVKKIEKNEKI
jgi:hypothetical protein